MTDEITGRNFHHLSRSLVFLAKKWNIEIIRDMFSGKKHFKEFKRSYLSNKVLSNCLKNLESEGIIEKKMSNSTPTSTKYYLTSQGRELNRIIYEITVFSLEGSFTANNALVFLAKKWNIEIIRDMFFGKKHFKEFKEGKPDLSNKVLSDCLKNLGNNDIIEKRTITSTHTTEYYLTELGKSLNRVLYELAAFALKNCDDNEFIDESACIQIKEDFRETLKINY